MSSVKYYQNDGQKWGFSIVEPGFVVVNIDLSWLGKNIPRAQAWLGEQVLQSSRARMPMKTGILQQRSHTEDGGKKVVFPGPYGRFQYEGLVMEGVISGSAWALPGESKVVRQPHQRLNYSRAEATDHWFEAAKETDKEAWIKGTREELLRR